MWEKPQVSSHKRGYGRAHQKRRAALLPFAYGKLCPLCGYVMEASQALDLDHSVPIVLGGTIGDRIVHRVCNQRSGSQLGNAIQQAAKNKQSRDW